MTQIVGPMANESWLDLQAQSRSVPVKFSWVEFADCTCGKRTSQRFRSKEDAAKRLAEGLVIRCYDCRVKYKRNERREMVGLCLRLEARRAEIREEQRKR